MSTWKLSPALVTLRQEINAAYPDRSRISDGSIGDAAHSSRTSDHNPDAGGWVRAIDVTQWDPHTPTVPGDDVAEALAEFLRAGKDRRTKYVIWRGRMFSSYSTATRKPWEWGPYHGPNGHFHHVHISVVPGPVGLDAADWGFTRPTRPTRPAPPPVHQEDDDMTPDQAEQLASAETHAAAADLRCQALESELAKQDAKIERILASLKRLEAR